MADKTTPAKATWARWNWAKGFGRGHRLFADGDLTKTACSSPRKNATHTAVKTYGQRPADGPICPTCKSLDDLLAKVMTGACDAISTTKVEVTAAPAEKIAVPAGACFCGAAKCDMGGVREIRLALAEQAKADAAAERLAKEAAFEAFLATKGTVAA